MPDVTRRLARLRVPLGFGAGVLVVVLAQPRWNSILLGGLVASVGEGIRIWSAGHLEKSREVTRSGPYRVVRHPLYLGSSVMGLGVAVACASLTVVLITGVYLAVTLTAAIRTEEAFLRERFGDEYDAYCQGDVAAARHEGRPPRSRCLAALVHRPAAPWRRRTSRLGSGASSVIAFSRKSLLEHQGISVCVLQGSYGRSGHAL
jgi:hypothetical protein